MCGQVGVCVRKWASGLTGEASGAVRKKVVGWGWGLWRLRYGMEKRGRERGGGGGGRHITTTTDRVRKGRSV